MRMKSVKNCLPVSKAQCALCPLLLQGSWLKSESYLCNVKALLVHFALKPSVGFKGYIPYFKFILGYSI